MLRRIPLRLAVAVAAALLPLTAQISSAQKMKSGQPPQHREHKRLEREQIIDLEHQWQSAALTDDIPAMDKLLSEDYLGITATGEVLTKAQELDHMRDGRLVIKQLQLSDFKVKLIGRIAIVTSLAHVEGSLDGDPLNGAFRYTRVYQRVANGVWKITNFEITPATHLHAPRG